MSCKGFFISCFAVSFFFPVSGLALEGTDGTAVVRVITTPAYRDAKLQFTGSPAGVVRLDQEGSATIGVSVARGQHLSTLTSIDPALERAGYRLADVRCDDPASAQASTGDARNRRATFEIDEAETVTCTFTFQPALACKCPKEGRWSVNNHTGSMVCSGVMSMTMPLEAVRSTGMLDISSGCDTVVAKGLSEDEKDLTMVLQPDCSWEGVVGGQQDGLPTTINFHWNVEDETHIAGSLDSTYSLQGVTCRMARTFELDFEG